MFKKLLYYYCHNKFTSYFSQVFRARLQYLPVSYAKRVLPRHRVSLSDSLRVECSARRMTTATPYLHEQRVQALLPEEQRGRQLTAQLPGRARALTLERRAW